MNGWGWVSEAVRGIYSITLLGFALALLRYGKPALALGWALAAAITSAKDAILSSAKDAATSREQGAATLAATVRIEAGQARIEHDLAVLTGRAAPVIESKARRS